MSTELSKAYEPSAVEAEAYRVWLDEKCFRGDPAAAGQPFSVVIPPPNVTGALHLGHAVNNTLQDILVRRKRMQGFNTVWIPGIDHAGIATQAVVEKQLKEKEDKTRHDIGREALVERIWKWKEKFGNRILNQLQRVGCSCDWDRTRFTLDEQCARAVRETFYKLFCDGLIYRGKRLVNWDVFLQTSVSDDEIYYEPVKTFLWYIRYPVEGTDKYLMVATTRPETMLGDTAVAVHPDDPRWNWAVGKQVRLPLTNRLIPIIADPILVSMEFGTGCVKVTPAHDPNDYAVWQRQAGNIDLINILTPEGKILDDPRWKAYSGLKGSAARKKIVGDLSVQGFLEKEEPYETQVGHSDRSKTAIEPYLSDQWFIQMAPLAEPALKVVREKTIKFTPDRFAKTFLDWLGEKRDWPISRQLWWGHRIPIWSRDLELPADMKPEPCPQRGPDTQTCAALDRAVGGKWSDFTKGLGEYFLRVEAHPTKAGWVRTMICIRNEKAPLQAKLETAGWVQDPDVLDTWFSSALWPHSTLGWPEQTPELAKYYPTAVLVTSRDIITLWVARMVMTGLYNMRGIPFHDVYIHPTILDGKGERMSKSKGNGVDPVEIIESHGADALRFTMTQLATETQDVRLPVKKDAQGRNSSEKFDAGRNFCNKLWNAARFAFSNIEQAGTEAVDPSKWTLADRWILSCLTRAVREADEAIDNYRFDAYAKVCYDFFWRDLCDWYVEAVKPAMKDPARAPQTANVLAVALDVSLRLMHPMIPFITETLWWKLNDVRPERGLPGRLACPVEKRLIRSAWPKPDASMVDETAERQFATLRDVISAVRNLRNENRVEVKRTVDLSVAADAATCQLLKDNRELIEMLGTCTLKAAAPDLLAPANSARVTVAGCDLAVEGLVDPEAEQQRQTKQREEIEKRIKALEGRLANRNYIDKAPAKLVQETRDQLAAAKEELAKIG